MKTEYSSLEQGLETKVLPKKKVRNKRFTVHAKASQILTVINGMSVLCTHRRRA